MQKALAELLVMIDGQLSTRPDGRLKEGISPTRVLSNLLLAIERIMDCFPVHSTEYEQVANFAVYRDPRLMHPIDAQDIADVIARLVCYERGEVPNERGLDFSNATLFVGTWFSRKGLGRTIDVESVFNRAMSLGR